MNGPALVGIAVFLIYAIVQTIRDARARQWAMAAWGGLTCIATLWFLAG